MDNKNRQAKRFSIQIVVGIFTLIISTVIMIVVLGDRIDKAGDNLINVERDSIDNINPLLLADTEIKIDKTSNNVDIINNIKKAYNIDVIYGKSSTSIVKTVGAIPIYNTDEINTLLWGLVECLEKYPQGLIKEIQLYGYNVEIYLVDSFSNDNIALATRDSNNNFKIFLSVVKTTEKISKSVHHEFYHVLEYYMKLEFNINELYEYWTRNNPDGFKYNPDITKLTKEYVYGVTGENLGAYFITVYSKTAEQEDRAEVFADMMLRETMPSYYTDNLGAIKNKVIAISAALKSSFSSVKNASSLYWERYIY